ncbi:MAG: NADPH:quinone oxidoreductase family protein [Hyphomonas sp.]
MKAVLSKEVGGPESLVLEEVSSPAYGKGQVLIRVKACGVNFPDSLMIKDMYQFKPPRPFSPGGEVAGYVESVGEGVTHVKPGDRVLASIGSGGMAELAVAAQHAVMPIPDEMPFAEAAAFMMTYGTSYYALKDRADPKPGEKLFVLGAAGGVGIAAVELGKAMGLEVIAGCSSQEKVDFCLSKGADKGLVYARELDKDGMKAFSNDIKEISGGGVDIIYDAVGGNYAEPSLRAMNWKPFLVIAAAFEELTLLKSCDIACSGVPPARDPAAHAPSCSAYKEGKIRHVSNTYPLEKSADAIRTDGTPRPGRWSLSIDAAKRAARDVTVALFELRAAPLRSGLLCSGLLEGRKRSSRTSFVGRVPLRLLCLREFLSDAFPDPVVGMKETSASVSGRLSSFQYIEQFDTGFDVDQGLVIGFPAGIPKIPLNLTLLKSCDIRGVFWGAAVARDPAAHAQNVKELFELYKEGKIRPHVSNTYPLEKSADAILELTERRAQGKVVVVID